ncbi:MAG TPA: hypothetical protein VMI54_12175 [Polyangiaceae bacterium]|nr:hypothetical protein [Polyangiaceae bacterium]
MRAVTGFLVLGLVLGVAPRARAETPCPGARAEQAPSDERGFDAALARFTRLWQLTQSLVAEHERRDFERASEQYERFAALTRDLAERHAAEEERAFDDSVALYLQKRAVTQALERSRERAAP